MDNLLWLSYNILLKYLNNTLGYTSTSVDIPNSPETVSISSPEVVDYLVTHRCQLRCPFCQDHKDSDSKPVTQISEELPTDNWFEITHNFHRYGARRIVYSGGEPLLRDDIGLLIREARELGLDTTLSTNALLLHKMHREVMPWVTEIGIPLDGSTPEINALMRPPFGEIQFQAAINAIKQIHKMYPGRKITLRTVVTEQNYSDIFNFPEALMKEGIFQLILDHHVRWKIYQFSPIGDQFVGQNSEDLLLSTEKLLAIWAHLRKVSPGGWWQFEPLELSSESHLVVRPNGIATVGMMRSEVGAPNPSFEYVSLGDTMNDIKSVLEEWGRIKKV